MSTALVQQQAAIAPKDIENILMRGDLASLPPEGRLAYYKARCEALGLDPLARPFDYLVLNGKTVLYANKGCFEQLRANRKVSITIASQQKLDDLYVVVARAILPDGRQDEDTGAVDMKNLSGEKAANAILKAITKAKRRVTLSICGLGMLDETEVESIPGAMPVRMDEGGNLQGDSSVIQGHTYLTAWKGKPVPLDGHTFKHGSHDYCEACKLAWAKLSDAERAEEIGQKVPAPGMPPSVPERVAPSPTEPRGGLGAAPTTVSADATGNGTADRGAEPSLPGLAPAVEPEYITVAQRTRLFAIFKEAHYTEQGRKDWLKNNGYDSSNHILKSDYETVTRAVICGISIAQLREEDSKAVTEAGKR